MWSHVFLGHGVCICLERQMQHVWRWRFRRTAERQARLTPGDRLLVTSLLPEVCDGSHGGSRASVIYAAPPPPPPPAPSLPGLPLTGGKRTQYQLAPDGDHERLECCHHQCYHHQQHTDVYCRHPAPAVAPVRYHPLSVCLSVVVPLSVCTDAWRLNYSESGDCLNSQWANQTGLWMSEQIYLYLTT